MTEMQKDDNKIFNVESSSLVVDKGGTLGLRPMRPDWLPVALYRPRVHLGVRRQRVQGRHAVVRCERDRIAYGSLRIYLSPPAMEKLRRGQPYLSASFLSHRQYSTPMTWGFLSIPGVPIMKKKGKKSEHLSSSSMSAIWEICLSTACALRAKTRNRPSTAKVFCFCEANRKSS